MDTSVAFVTSSAVIPLIPSKVAVMLVVPAIFPSASPREPAALEIDATVVFEEAQVTWFVRSCVEPLEYVPVAVNCSE